MWPCAAALLLILPPLHLCQADPNSKLARWLNKAATAAETPAAQAPASTPPPAPEAPAAAPTGKLGRWLNKVQASAPAAGAVAGGGSAGGAESAEAVVRRCCEAVRGAWRAGDESGVGGGPLAGEWAKLEKEKKSLDALMQMVSAIRCPVAD